MKFLIVIACVASAYAVPYGGIVNTGASAVSRSEDGYGNYAFGYNEDHATGGTFRKEKGGPGVQVGSYGLRDADGRMRVVNYVADALGFRASVSTNEPGTDVKQDPAATNLNNGHLGAPILAPAVHAPLVAAPLAHAPLAHGYDAPLAHGYAAAPLAHGYAAAPLAHAPLAHAPLVHAPLAHAPLVHGAAYAVNTAHGAVLGHGLLGKY